MDDEQRKYFASMMAQLEGVASDARAAASTSRETAATVRKLDQRVGAVEGHVEILHKHVFGKPPTSSNPPAMPARPLSESIGDHDSEIATLAGQVIATRSEIAEVKSDVAAVKSQNSEQLEILFTLAKHPTVRKLGMAFAGLSLMIMTYAGLRLQAAITKLEATPPTTVQVQPAPTVYVRVLPDGGVQ